MAFEDRWPKQTPEQYVVWKAAQERNDAMLRANKEAAERAAKQAELARHRAAQEARSRGNSRNR